MDRLVTFLEENPDIDVQLSASSLRFDVDRTDIPRIRIRMTRNPSEEDELQEECRVSRWYPAYDFAEFADFILEEMADILKARR